MPLLASRSIPKVIAARCAEKYLLLVADATAVTAAVTNYLYQGKLLLGRRMFYISLTNIRQVVAVTNPVTVVTAVILMFPPSYLVIYSSFQKEATLS